MSERLVPKLKVPFAIIGKSAQTVEQDSEEEVVQCVEAVMRTPIGSHIDEPELGVPDFAFRSDVFSDDISNAIGEWEPRAEYTLSEEFIEESYERLVNIDTTRRE